jgi:hypothetical protein
MIGSILLVVFVVVLFLGTIFALALSAGEKSTGNTERGECSAEALVVAFLIAFTIYAVMAIWGAYGWLCWSLIQQIVEALDMVSGIIGSI